MRESIKRFREWQQRPYTVAPMSDEEHTCPTCKTLYRGNYCPRCGQSSRIGRYSAATALLLFIDVWGLGNRGMFRSLRDLVLRPGYMIRDYLGGMQMAYFPPFKMLFLLTALSVVVANGVNLRGTNMTELSWEQASVEIKSNETDTPEEKFMNERIQQYINKIKIAQERFPNALSLAFITALSVVLYFFFRHRRTGPRLSFPEFFIAMIYASNMVTIVEIVLTFVSASPKVVSAASLLAVIPLKQLTGFSWFSTLWRIVVSLALEFLLIIFFTSAGLVVSALLK